MGSFILNIIIIILNIFYVFFKILPTRNKIVFISRQSNNIGIDFQLLGEKLEEKYKVVYLCRKIEGGAHSKLKTKISYGFYMFAQMYHLATSKVCIIDSYCPAVSILHHKKSLTIVQIWHSIGNMKKFGYRILGLYEGSNYKIAKTMKMHKNYTYAYVASKAYRKDLSLGFNIPEERFKIFTLPRIDLLNDKKYEKSIKEKIYKKYPILKEKENIVYAPTFRKDESEFNKKLDELTNYIDFDKYNFIVKLHPLSKVIIKNKKVIIDNDFSTFDILFVTDKLISDYSCIIYEAGVRNIPVYFYKYDIEKYINERGLAIDYSELPGFQEKEAEDLVKDLEKKYNMKYYKKFIKKYVTNTKKCTEKIVKDIEKYMK